MGKKQGTTAASKISSAAPPAASSATSSSHKTSVLKSAFSPSHFQLHLFASVIQSFESQQLRIHDTATGRLRGQHEAKAGEKITCLDWGYYGPSYRESRLEPSKKKRRKENNAGANAVVAYGTSTSDIHMFSPAEGKLVGSLKAGHTGGVRDFKFAPSDYSEAFSVGDDASIVQWDLIKNHPIRVISLSDNATSILARPSQKVPQILCASSAPWSLETQAGGKSQFAQFDAFKNQIHSLFRSGFSDSTTPELFLAADTDRYVNIYDLSKRRLVRTLVAGGGVSALDLSASEIASPDPRNHQMLLALTRDGTVELFPQPFLQPKQVNGDLRASRKNLALKAAATVRLVNPDNQNQQVPIFTASIQGPDIILVSVEGAVDLSFQKLRWQDEGNEELLFRGAKEIPRNRASSSLNTATMNGVKDLGRTHVDESTTVVVNGGAGGAPLTNAVELSSTDEDAEDDDAESVDEPASEPDAKDASEGSSNDVMLDAKETHSDEEGDEDMADADADAGDEDQAEPSFGDLVAAKHPTTISISDSFKQAPTTYTISNGRAIVPPGMSLGTVLAQALRTNDNTILEGCLHYNDPDVVKNTIRRIDSSLAGLLLSKLAERLASRPGRYGHLIQWVQFTCIAHGGAIAAQPDVTAKIRTLYQVLNQRAKSLDNLLLLKGKLDMLDAQLAFRKEIAAERPPRADVDEPGMIYIEGADNWDSDDDLDEDSSRPNKRSKRKRKALEDLVSEDESDEDEDGEMLALANGMGDSESEEESDDEDDAERSNGINGRLALLDDEAEVSSAADSDPDDDRSNPADADSSEGEESDESGSEELEDEGEDDEEDSEMDSFINDGSIDMASDEDDIHVSGDESASEENVPPAPEPEPEPEPMPVPAKRSSNKDKRKGKK